MVPIDYARRHAAALNERKRLALGAHDAVGIVTARDVPIVIQRMRGETLIVLGKSVSKNSQANVFFVTMVGKQ